ncbi:MAG: hypothetical protein AB7N80_00745 [Bdellovibrionales bacterium]
MKRLGGLLVSALIASATAAEGQELIGQVKANGNLKTSYSISNDQTSVTTTAADVGNKYESKMDSYLFPSLKAAVQGMAFVSSVMQTKGSESVETSSWADYDTKKRKSHAFVKLALQSPLTLLFEIEESYRACKAESVKTSTDSESGTTTTTSCSKQSELTIRGPVAVYGNYANSINVDALLRNKQEINLNLSKDYSGKDTNMVSRFMVKSISFDESLARFFRVFNIPVFVGHGGDLGYGNGLLDKVSPLTSRQRLMLGISRVVRSANERIMN